MILPGDEQMVLAAVEDRLRQIESTEGLVGFHQGRVYLSREGRPLVVSVYRRHILTYAVDTDEFLVERRQARYALIPGEGPQNAAAA